MCTRYKIHPGSSVLGNSTNKGNCSSKLSQGLAQLWLVWRAHLGLQKSISPLVNYGSREPGSEALLPPPAPNTRAEQSRVEWRSRVEQLSWQEQESCQARLLALAKPPLAKYQAMQPAIYQAIPIESPSLFL